MLIPCPAAASAARWRAAACSSRIFWIEALRLLMYDFCRWTAATARARAAADAACWARTVFSSLARRVWRVATSALYWVTWLSSVLLMPFTRCITCIWSTSSPIDRAARRYEKASSPPVLYVSVRLASSRFSAAFRFACATLSDCSLRRIAFRVFRNFWWIASYASICFSAALSRVARCAWAALAWARFDESVSAEAVGADIAATTAMHSTGNPTSARVDGARRRAWPRANDMGGQATKACGGLQRLTVRYRPAMPPVSRISRWAK